MSDPEIQALVVDIVQIRLRIMKIKDKEILEFLITIHDLDTAELNELPIKAAFL